jgi:hypothetical protein
MSKNNMGQWQKFVAEIRQWDRDEHNWYETHKRNGSMPTRNLVTKNDFIHSLMKKYKLIKRK